MMAAEMRYPLLLLAIATALLAGGCQDGHRTTVATSPNATPNTALARQENDRAKERERREEDRDHRRRVGAAAPKVERDDWFLGARLGEDEQDVTDEAGDDQADDERQGGEA